MSSVLRGLAAMLISVSALAAQAQQAYPNRPVRMLVPFPPGGSLDFAARLLGEKLTQTWGQAVVVDNRPGGNTIIGTQAAAKAPPDGYTLLLTASTHVINPLLMSNLPYDSEKDFIPVATLIKSEFVLVINPSVPAKNLQEFIALARSKPDQINYSSAGLGNGGHIAGELFNQIAGVKMHHVPYKGGAPAIADLIGGQVQAHFAVPSTALPYLKSGKLRALAYTGTTPPQGLVGVPSFAQAGLPQYDLRTWQGIMLPAGTPKAIVDKLGADLAKTMADPEVQEKLASAGLEAWYNGHDAFNTVMEADKKQYSAIIRSANIRLE